MVRRSYGPISASPVALALVSSACSRSEFPATASVEGEFRVETTRIVKGQGCAATPLDEIFFAGRVRNYFVGVESSARGQPGAWISVLDTSITFLMDPDHRERPNYDSVRLDARG